jgi:hypothetical protein
MLAPARALIEDCWEDDLDDRPTFEEIVDWLAEMQFRVPGDVNSAKVAEFGRESKSWTSRTARNESAVKERERPVSRDSPEYRNCEIREKCRGIEIGDSARFPTAGPLQILSPPASDPDLESKRSAKEREGENSSQSERRKAKTSEATPDSHVPSTERSRKREDRIGVWNDLMHRSPLSVISEIGNKRSGGWF